jgi:hypothetical protein
MMSNALDAFKAQRTAVQALRADLAEVATLVSTLQPQFDRLKIDQALKDTLDAETKWLVRVQELVRDVRAFREVEFRRFRLGVVWRWALACLFALAAIGVGEAARARAENPTSEELEQLRAQAAFAAVVQQRVSTMTPAERQQFDRLMKTESHRGR